jgi:hypothetical protein
LFRRHLRHDPRRLLGGARRPEAMTDSAYGAALAVAALGLVFYLAVRAVRTPGLAG